MQHYCLYSMLLAVAVASSSCTSHEVKADAAVERRVPVPVARVTRQDLSSRLVLAADFRPFLDIDLHAKVAGYLKNITVDIGDRVRAGQLLAVLEVPELGDELEQAAAEISRSRSEVVRAQDDLRRAESAHAASHANYTRLAEVIKSRPNLVAQQEIDDARSKDLVGEAQVSAAQAALESARNQVNVALAKQSRLKTLYAYSRITAPFAGVITKRYADPGAMIQAGTASQTQAMPLVTLAQADLLRLIVPVPESAAAQVRIGAPVDVRVPALNRSFEGRVARFTRQVRSSTRTMDTEVDVRNPKLELVPGMYAYATLSLGRKAGALSIPLQAVAGVDTTSPSVLVVNGRGELERRAVRLGIESASRVEVLEGLQENELVVAGNLRRYRPGEAVAPKPVEEGL
ncbi:MAG: efflux RND transporter periplasmic adaptor subunit [Acidobacteriota bacterium]